MKFTFDILKNRWIVFAVFLLNILVPIFLWGYLRTPDYRSFIPASLYQNNLIPVLLFILPAAFFIINRKRLFWKKAEVLLDQHKMQLEVDGKVFSLQEMVYYEFQPGSIVSSGSRDIFIIKFRSHEKFTFIPCRSSRTKSDYDKFIQNFLRCCENNFSDNRERLIGAPIKFTLFAILTGGIMFFIYMYSQYGKSIAIKMIPGLLMALSIFPAYIFKKRKKSRNDF